METAELKQQLKQQIIEFLNLTDTTPESIQDDKPLFGDEGLGLDSIVGSSRVDLQACKLEYSIVSPK